MSVRGFWVLSIACTGLIALGASERPKLTASAINTFFEQELLEPVRESQPDWISDLAVTFPTVSLDRDKPQLAARAGVTLRHTSWSETPTRITAGFALSTAYDKVNPDLNDFPVTLNLAIQTRTVPFLRYVADRMQKDNCGTTAGKDTPKGREARRAACAFAVRLAAARDIGQVASAVIDSTSDLTAQLSDYDRETYGQWRVLPQLRGPAGNQTLTVTADRDGFPLAGHITLTAADHSLTLAARLQLQRDDAGKATLIQMIDTFLGGALETRPDERLALRKALVAFVQTLKPPVGK
jgi:hypothetical protein